MLIGHIDRNCGIIIIGNSFIVYLLCNEDKKRRIDMKKRIHEMSLIELVLAMSETQDPVIMNRLILEKTYRQYVPFEDKTFEELLVENGYRVIEKGNNDSNYRGNNK